jgi:ABC-type bacteriocin/lantibiotic exporter with double-glycine peptidase domain
MLTFEVSISLSSLVGKMMVPRQTVYQKATQSRINFTSEVLGSIKAVKMLGLTEKFNQLIAKKRDEELAVGIHFRKVSVYSNCISTLEPDLRTPEVWLN